MLKRAALIFGAFLILAGLLGFVEAVAPHREPNGDALLFGIFAVNGFHNLVHLVSGLAGVICGLRSETASGMYFRTFGLVYGLVTIAGIFVGHGYLMGMAHNPADVGLHALVTAVALYLGFARGTRHPQTSHHAG